MAAVVEIVFLQESPKVNSRDLIEVAQGLALLRARGVEAAGHLVRTPRHRESLAANVLRHPPQILFIYVGDHQLSTALALVHSLRDRDPRCIVAVGGPLGTLAFHDFSQPPATSAILLGEWLETLCDLAISLGEQSGPEQVPGIWWRSQSGWIFTGRRRYSPALNLWPDPDLAEFRADDLARFQGASLPILASRGFPFKGLFNAESMLRNLPVAESFYFVRPVERIIEEALRLRADYRLRHFEFADFIFPWDTEWLAHFAQLWSRHIRLPFRIRTISEHLLAENMECHRMAGLAEIDLSLESGNETLRRTHSDLNQSNVNVREAISACAAIRIRTHLNLLVGVPGETQKTIESTVNFARAANASSASASIYTPWPQNSQWLELERQITGTNHNLLQHRDHPEMARDFVQAIHEVQKIHSLGRALQSKRRSDTFLDGLADVAMANVRSPYEGAFKVSIFHSAESDEEVIALRVPSEISWPVKIPRDPFLEFGILIEPTLPGERSRLPISFSVKITQDGRTWRLFQKVLIQALDPDSRRWHWFRIPVTQVKVGLATITFENIVFGNDPYFIPPGKDVWAGWARIYVTSQTKSGSHEAAPNQERETADRDVFRDIFTEME